MSSTTVRSKNSKSTASIAGSVFNPTKETLKFPPEAQVFKVIPSYVKEQENVEIQVGEGFVTDKNELVKADGTVLEMKKPSAFKEIKEIEEHKAKTDKMRRASKEEEYR
jgi:RNase P/RNase MRP subunit p29